ncbi:MAG: LytTR family DNA-binding domain-containing protein [Bacteroidota bacterium]
MPEVSGIGLLKMLTVPPVVILTTAYSEYALESYEYNVADYLLKPVRFERFEKAIAKARALRLSQVVVGENKFSGDSFEFRMDGKVHRVPFHDILFLQSLGNYVRLFTERKTYLILKTTRETEEQLPRSDFVRTHKSFIVNINKMRGYDQHFVMINDHKLPIGKIYKRNFLEQKNRFH